MVDQAVASRSFTETILVTGGLGYIGSHTVVQLCLYLMKLKGEFLNKEKPADAITYQIAILDNLSNCSILVLDRIKSILKDAESGPIPIIDFFQLDVLDTQNVEKMFVDYKNKNQPINYIIHLAGKKAVGEAVQNPLYYYQVNVMGSLCIMQIMEKYDCKHFIFSSTATVYGNSNDCTEVSPIIPLQPYADTKVCVEMIMKRLGEAKPHLSLISLRYFNPAGAHSSGLIGDAPTVFPNNLFPYIEQVAIGKRPKLNIFGNDYKTHDGTGVRDYFHVVDLAEGHVAAFKKIQSLKGFNTYNLGSGKGQSVLDIVKAYSKVLGRELPYEITARRPGDIDILCARVDKANKELGWKAEKSLEDICRDSYNFILKNPNGIQ